MEALSGAQDMGNFRDKVSNSHHGVQFDESDFNYLGLINQHFFKYQRQKNDQQLNINLSYSVSQDPVTDELEQYISVALYSQYDGEGIKENPRPNVRLCVVLDISGSMNDHLNTNSKIEVSKTSLIKMLDSLRNEDFLSITLFDDQSYVLHEMRQFSEINKKQLIEQIKLVQTKGGTNFQNGYKGALQEFQDYDKKLDDEELEKSKKEIENRIFIFTDAQPNLGATTPDSLLGMMISGSERKIYTTFFGVGLDFNSALVDKITKTYGANYYQISNPDDFNNLVTCEFDYMVFTSTFDLSLKTDAKVLNVYGTPDTAQDSQSSLVQILSSSPSYVDKRGTKGGVILLKVDPSCQKANFNLTYRVRSGEICQLEKHVEFQQISKTSQTKYGYYSSDTARKVICLVREVRTLKFLCENLSKPEELKRFQKHTQLECFKILLDYIQEQQNILQDQDFEKEKILVSQIQQAYEKLSNNDGDDDDDHHFRGQ